MLRGQWGEEAAQRALLLALLISCIMCWSGCRHNDLSPIGRHSVRVDALLSLHPAWAQVTSLDHAIAEFQAHTPQSGQIAPDLPPMPSRFTPPQTVPSNLAQERQRAARENAARYVQQLADSLRLRDEGVLQREEEREAKETLAQYRRELAARETGIRAERTRQARELDRQITKLRFQDVAFQTQIAVYKDQALADATLQHNKLLAEINTLSEQRAALVDAATIQSLAVAAMQPRRLELDAASARRLKEKGEAFAKQRADRVQAEQSRLVNQIEDLPPIEQTPLPPDDGREAPLALPPAGESQAAMNAAEAQMRGSRTQQQAAWTAQRNRLIAAIRSDTQNAVAQIAQQRGWKLVLPGTPLAQDDTSAVAPLLRAQWQQGKTP